MSYILKLIFPIYLSRNSIPSLACFFSHSFPSTLFPKWLLVFLSRNVNLFLFKLLLCMCRSNCTPKPAKTSQVVLHALTSEAAWASGTGWGANLGWKAHPVLWSQAAQTHSYQLTLRYVTCAPATGLHWQGWGVEVRGSEEVRIHQDL